MARMVAWVGVVFGAVYLIYAGGGWWGIYSPILRIITMSLAIGVLVSWGYAAWHRPSWRPRSHMLPAIGAILGSLAVSTTVSRVPRVSLEYLGYAVVLAAMYLLLVRLFAHEFFRKRIVTLAVMLFGVSVAGYGAQVVGGWFHWWSLIGHIDIPPLRPDYGGLTYNNPSAALTMISLLGATVVGALGNSTRRGVGVVVGVAVIVAAVALVSGSRSGWFALGATAVIAVLVWLRLSRNRALLVSVIRSLLRRREARILAVGLAVAGAAVLLLLTPSIIRRVFEGGEDLRLSLYVAALRIFEIAPIAGTGPGSWVILRPAFTQPGDVDFYIPHAHDIYVQALAELGLVGGIAGLVLLWNLLRVLRSATSRGDERLRWWAWAAGLGLLYFGLHQVLDSYANMPAFLFAAAIPIAYIDAVVVEASGEVSASPSLRRSRLPRSLAFAAAGLVAVATAGLIAQEAPALQEDQAVRAANAGDWEQALGPALSAAAADPDIGSYLLTAGLASDRAGDHAAAQGYFLRLARTAELPEAWLNAAAQQRALGDSRAALESVTASMRLGYQRPAVAMPAGELALELGDSDLAREGFANAIATIPSLAGDPWWQADATRAALFPSVVEAAVSISSVSTPDRTWEIPLMTGDASRALALAPPGVDLPALAINAWQGDRVAQSRLFGVCAEDPLQAAALLWCARIADRIGDGAAGARYRETAGVIAVSLAKHGAELRVSPTATRVGQLPGSIADLWATYTYRRPSPWDILVPSLVHLQLE